MTKSFSFSFLLQVRTAVEYLVDIRVELSTPRRRVTITTITLARSDVKVSWYSCCAYKRVRCVDVTEVITQGRETTKSNTYALNSEKLNQL